MGNRWTGSRLRILDRSSNKSITVITAKHVSLIHMRHVTEDANIFILDIFILSSTVKPNAYSNLLDHLFRPPTLIALFLLSLLMLSSPCPTTQINRYLLATAKLVATIAAITPRIPKNQPNPVLDLPGTGTFIPKRPQIKFSGTRILAKSVIFDKTWLARLPCRILSTDSWAR